MAKKPTKKRGRPKGSTNRKWEFARFAPSRCPSCNCTGVETVPGAKPLPDQKYSGSLCDTCQKSHGKHGLRCVCGGHYLFVFTHIVRRRVRCASCGQWRIDMAYENRAATQNST